MAQFIIPEDYDASIHQEILDALIRSDRQIVEICEDRAIAIYHIFSIHNPRNMSQIRVDRYERAVEWLKGVRKGDISVDGLPEIEQEAKEAASQFQIRSNPKRNNRF